MFNTTLKHRLALSVFSLLATYSFNTSATTAQHITVIGNVTVFDATGSAPFTADVLIRDGRFSEIAPSITRPAEAQYIDGTGLSLLPGLIDVHVHWTTMGGVNRADIATRLLLSGVTTATDFHSAPESFAPKREWHQQLISPHVIYTARTATAGGHGADWGDENMTRLAVSARDGQYAVANLQQYQPDMIKVFADGWRYGNGINNATINVNALTAIVEQARTQQLPVVTHTVTVDGAKTAAKAGVTAIVHAVQDRKADDELITLLQERKVIYAPTLAVYEPRSPQNANSGSPLQMIEYRQQVSRYNLQRFAQAGIPVALGTDSGIAGTQFGEASLRELELLVDFGLSPQQAIIAGTINSATVLGLQADRGTIEAGKRADFVLVRGQPWQHISDYRKTEFVFVDGQLVAKNGQLVAQQGQPLPPAKAAQAVIDDFERKDGLTAGSASRLADTEYGFPRSVLISQTVPRGDKGQALQLSAQLAQKDAPKALIVLPLTRGGFAAVDASAFTGVRFDVRGDGGQYSTELISGSGTTESTFAARSEWQTLEIPFSQFKGEHAVSAAEIFALKLGAKRTGGEKFWLEIDNVRFYR